MRFRGELSVYKIAAALMLLMSATLSAYAARVAPGWIHEHWTTADGLPVNVVSDIAQSDDGYIWLATFDGLVRFDGMRFAVFNSATNPELPSNRFTTVIAAADGALWLISEQRHLLRFSDGRFETMDTASGLPSGEVVAIEPAPDGSMLVGTRSGLARYRDGRFEHLAVQDVGGYVHAILQGEDGALWLGTDDGAVGLTGGGIERITADHGLSPGHVRSLAFVDDVLWIGSFRGLFFWDGRAAHRLPGAEAVSGLEILTIAEEGDIVWLTTSGGVYGYRHGRIDHRPGADEHAMLLSQVAWADESGATWLNTGRRLLRDGVTVFQTPARMPRTMTDHEGNLWIAAENGVHRLREGLFTVWRSAHGLVSENIYPVLQDRAGAVWLGTLDGGLARIRDGAVEVFGPEADMTPAVWTLAEDADGTLWVGGTGLCRFDGERCGREDIPGTLVLATVRAIHRDRGGMFWFGSSAGLFRLSDDGWRRYTTADNVPRQEIRVFAEASDGTLWMGTNGSGIVRFSDGRFTPFATKDGLCSDLIRAIHIDGDALWLGTEDRGLCHVELPVNGALNSARIDQTHGLYDYTVHRILADDDGHLWMSGNRGIWRMDKDELRALVAGDIDYARSTAYTERDGLPTREANGGVHPAGIRDREGRLWFPTQAGAVVIDPRSLPLDPPPPNALVERVAAGTGDHRKVFDAADRPTTLALTPRQRQLEIEYAAPSFVDPSGIRFRYRLEGLDEGWVEAGARRQTTYANLRPGEYRFRVIAGNSEGVWNDNGDSFTLTVPARWYETWTFYVLCALLLVATGLLVGQWRRRELERRRQALEVQVDERTSELQQALGKVAEQTEALQQLDRAKSRFFANISHEFRTPLTVILGGLRENLGGRFGALSTGLESQHQAMLRNTSRLQRLIEQILDLNRLEAGRMELEPEPGCVVEFLKYLIEIQSPLAECNGVDLELQCDTETCPRLFDADKLEKIIGNILANALKFTPRGGSVRVLLACTDPVAISVIDTGPGIPPEAQQRIFDRFYRADERAQIEGTGIGLALAFELTQLHRGDIELDSTPGQGSIFTIRLPLEQPQTSATAGRPTPGHGDDAVGRGSVPDGQSPGRPQTSATRTGTGAGAQNETEPDRTTILIIEDHDDVRAYLRRTLADDYRVLEAADGEQGLRQAREALPDLIVSDVMLPGIDGFEIARELKAEPTTGCIPVIMLTARAADTDQAGGYQAGAEAYLTKPFSPETLLAAAARLLAERQRLKKKLMGENLAGSAPASMRDRTPATLIERARAIIGAHLYDEDFGIDQLASELAMGRSNLYESMKNASGDSPARLIRTMRLERARDLLGNGAGSVSEVAYAVGFKSLSHFTRNFQTHFGCAPSSYF